MIISKKSAKPVWQYLPECTILNSGPAASYRALLKLPSLRLFFLSKEKLPDGNTKPGAQVVRRKFKYFMDHNAQNVQVYNRFVREYMDRFMDLSLYRDSFDPLLEMLPGRSSVLELGCGPGNVVKYLKTKRADLRVLGIDLAPKMVRAARTANPDAEFRLMDIRDAGQIEDRFHAVIAAFCIPYLSSRDLPRLFHDIQRQMLPGGLLYLSFMEGPGDRSGFEKTSFTGESELFISYYTRQEIESLLKENRFTIKQVLSKDYPEADGSVTTDLIYIATKSGS